MTRNINDDCILGVDLGATSLRIARVSAGGGAVLRFATPSRAVAEDVIPAMVRQAIFGRRVLGVGLSRAPGLDRHGRVSEWPSRPDWNGMPLISWLSQAAGAELSSLDDGACGALWEQYTLQHDTGVNGVTACISIGTGLAIGIACGGESLPLGDGAATLAHQTFSDLHWPCKCGKRGCLQTVLSANGLHETVLAGEVESLRRAFTQMVKLLRDLYGVDHLVVSGGGVDRFGAPFIGELLERSSDAAGVVLRISSTPALSALAGALLLGSKKIEGRGEWWAGRTREFLPGEGDRCVELAEVLAEAAH